MKELEPPGRKAGGARIDDFDQPIYRTYICDTYSSDGKETPENGGLRLPKSALGRCSTGPGALPFAQAFDERPARHDMSRRRL